MFALVGIALPTLAFAADDSTVDAIAKILGFGLFLWIMLKVGNRKKKD